MQVSDVTADRVRRLAETRTPHGRVLSIYLNLDPSEFATPAARRTEIQSLLDEAERQVRDIDDNIPRDARLALRDDVARVRDFFDNSFSAEGAHGLAVFSSGPAGLFEVLRLARPVETMVAIDEAPFIEPLAEAGTSARWCVALVNRSNSRILRGTAERLREVERITDQIRGQHDEGGWSQANYERSIERDVDAHLDRVAETLFRRFKAVPFDHLVIGAPHEMCSRIEAKLHSYLRQRVAGCIHIPVETSSPDDVLAAVTPVVGEDERRREREALDRLAHGVGSGDRAAAGLEAVLDALTERRVETVLVAERFSTPGTVCPTDGWLGPEGIERCPIDDTPLRHHPDIVPIAVEAAIAQSADVIFVRHYEDLGPLGQIGAVLRF
jgi:peptide chain release factor subunit 1